MRIEADISEDPCASIAINYDGPGFHLCFYSAEGEIEIQLSFDQLQTLTDYFAENGFEPSEKAKKELEKIKSECE